MFYLAAVFSEKTADFSLDSPLQNLCLHLADFSRQGEIALIDAKTKLLPRFKQHRKLLSLQVDVLIKEQQLAWIIDQLRYFYEQGVTLRFENLGLARRMLDFYPDLKFQLLLPYHSKTSLAAVSWLEYFGSGLTRVVLSPEITSGQLSKIKQALSRVNPEIETEIMAAGRLPLFYSARQLELMSGHHRLTKLDKLHQKQLGLLVNQAGFSLFHEQDLFILDLKDEIKLSAVDALKLDFYRPAQWQVLNEQFAKAGWESKLKLAWGTKTTAGFFRSNRTDRPLRYLKNTYLEAERHQAVGYTVDYVRDAYTVILLEKHLRLPQELLFKTPDGFTSLVSLKAARKLGQQQLTTELNPGYYVIEPIRRAISKTMIQIKPQPVKSQTSL